MKSINFAMVFEETHVTSKEKLVSLVDKESVGKLVDHHEEPGYFFRGAVFGFILCIPFWGVILWFITR